MSKNRENKYQIFFEKIKIFKEKQEKQKQRGLNDYNILTAVLRADDEVKLHSRMIASLLNPKGVHNQGSLFLEHFLAILQLDDFKLNLESVDVFVEYQDIDLYMTDGKKHIIIENKIWAKDQECQIIKYINIIKEENEINSDENDYIHNIQVIYLTQQDKEYPDEHIVKNGYISFDTNKTDKLKECSCRARIKQLVPNGLKNYFVPYKKISYKNEILSWLKKCQWEVQNITNLNEVFKQYKDVVKILNNEYKGKVMSISEVLKQEENFKIAYEVFENFPETCAKLESEFWEKLITKVQDIPGYLGIENKLNDEIENSLSSETIKNIRAKKGEKSEVNLHFAINDTIQLIIGAWNDDNGIYAVVFKKGWGKMDTDNDEKIKKTINDLYPSFDVTENWNYANGMMNENIDLRNESLIEASQRINELKEQISELVTQLKSIKL